MLDESDGRLLARFAIERDESAFATLVERHGPLVLRVALRMLRRREDAEDVFQAVFMVLARRAASRWEGTTIAGWLHGVTVRVCLNQRKMERRRRQRMEELASSVKERNDMDGPDAMRWMIDEQLADLPQRFREVIVLCDLEGMAQQEVAKQLALPLGTVSSRLARGREQLRKRLARQGVCVAALGTAATFACLAEAATKLPENLLQSTVRQADAFVWGTTAARAALSLQTKTLAEGALRAMMITRVKTIVCFIAVVAASMFGGALAPDIIPELSRTASAKPVLLEPFTDGNANDGSPSSWVLLSDLGFGDGTMDATSGDLVMTPNSNTSLIAVVEPAFDLSELSIRTQIRNRGLVSPTIHGTGVLINGSLETLANIDVGIQTDGEVYVTIHSGNGNADFDLGNVQTDLNPTVEDVILQVDLFGGVVNARAWRAGEPMPDTPLISGISPLPPGGSIGIYANPPSENSSATFRYINVADQPIVPEPGSRTLCAIGSGLLVAGLLYGSRRRRWAR